MMQYKTLLEESLEAWAYASQGVINEVKNIPAKNFGFRPTPENRSVTELVQHIIESGLMMSGELPRPNGNFRRQSYSRFIKEYADYVRKVASKRELLDLLRSTHAEGEKKFREAGEVFVLQLITQFDGSMATRFSWMQHGIAHEEYHRGQLALYARLLGIVPALTKLIMGE